VELRKYRLGSDPGPNLASPALPFTRISASVSRGVTVNNITYTDPTHVTLDLNTIGAAAGMNVSGSISAADVGQVKANSGHNVP
jgi:hypothetical protein